MDPLHRVRNERRSLMFNRRLLLQALSGAIAAPAAASSKKTVVTILGDSVTAGLGLPADQALPARLQRALIALGVDAVVRGAGVSGDTTAGGLARIDFSRSTGYGGLCGGAWRERLLPVGSPANHSEQPHRYSCAPEGEKDQCGSHLQSISPKPVQDPMAGNSDAVFAAAARSQAVTLSPNLFEGVLDRPGFRQADGVHPNAAGADLIAHRLAPTVARVIRAREA